MTVCIPIKIHFTTFGIFIPKYWVVKTATPEAEMLTQICHLSPNQYRPGCLPCHFYINVFESPIRNKPLKNALKVIPFPVLSVKKAA